APRRSGRSNRFRRAGAPTVHRGARQQWRARWQWLRAKGRPAGAATWLALQATAHPAAAPALPPITTPQLMSQLTAAIQNLKSLRCAADASERIGTKYGRQHYILRSDYPQFKYIAYKAGKNETPATIAARFGCGEYRILERNKLDVGDKLDEGQVLQVPNAYGRRTLVVVDPKTFLPTVVAVYDERGLFEKYDFSNVVANQPIPPAEFT
nr:hypothetical protein [Tanacetum cinerariifolium]